MSNILPILVYAWRVIERVGESLCLTHTDYGQDMSRRVAAFVSLSARQSAHITEQIEKFHDAHRSWMLKHCTQMGFPKPLKRDVERMALTGALPGEDEASVQARHDGFNTHAELARLQELAEDSD